MTRPKKLVHYRAAKDPWVLCTELENFQRPSTTDVERVTCFYCLGKLKGIIARRLREPSFSSPG